ncbi:hypothetical protein Ddc_20219 [Ditylenchus destructor]|nr:hypothetical protein Ddc_20219 [Ditylenchus destructor]
MSLKVFLYTHLILSTASTPYHLYLVGWWRPPNTTLSPLYDPVWLYWTGLLGFDYMFVARLPVLLLIVDRCLIFHFSVRYNGKLRNIVSCAGIAAIVITFFAATWLVFLGYPTQADQSCETLSCLLRKSVILPLLLTKSICAILNTTGCLYFMFLLKKTTQLRLRDRVVKFTIIIEVLLNVIPSFFFYILNLVTSGVIANYVGGLGGTLVTLDAALCAIFYSVILLKHRERDSIGVAQLGNQNNSMDALSSGNIYSQSPSRTNWTKNRISNWPSREARQSLPNTVYSETELRSVNY